MVSVNRQRLVRKLAVIPLWFKSWTEQLGHYSTALFHLNEMNKEEVYIFYEVIKLFNLRCFRFSLLENIKYKFITIIA